MRIESLTLRSFRNYENETVSFDPRCNVIFGANAQGKTNLLEALVYLSTGKSPRARTDKEMIGFDADSALLSAKVFARERDFVMTAELFRGKRRKLTVNKVAAKNAAALSAVYNTVFFVEENILCLAAVKCFHCCYSFQFLFKPDGFK